ncbi:MFS transporter [Iodobacter sp. CM08]|uniref:MFS transporter n=1 Tax=Iodobacter sp. CM08 TaxID=3085902 RepID=UPI002982212E|nr:MFS transporter [Iodobacter sp. CM08]MDW5416459.1 MFS transporter [Iodobacter sp. CM08]
MSRATHPRWRMMAYGLLGLPLAMAALPVYVQIPAYYSSNLGLALASTGWVLFLARLVDTLQDPWLGRYIDRLHGGLNPWLIAGAVLLGLAFLGLWLPPVSTAYLGAWLAVMLVVAYTAHSMLSIAYLSWGARLSADESNSNAALLGAAAWREGAGLLGVILASVIPSWILTRPVATIPSHLGRYGLSFAAILAVALFALIYYAPRWQRKVNQHSSWQQLWQTMQANQGFKSS